ncbi:MAG: DNA polymerase III subunit gamma/tau [Candidatus Woesebacteria bacterium]|jgi:DNA polymerase-3 subunit gamma/tau
MSWYRKHRPKKIKDLDLTNIRESLLKMLQSGKLPQVMLFAGPKGTGKTSTARIIAAILNEKKNEAQVDYLFFKGKKVKTIALSEASNKTDLAQKIFEGSSYVVQEMDAASNRGIDDIRALKERVSLPPQGAKMSVYILDEAHMLTNEAFNALLKLLEEPPQHSIFILATTELHKIPSTVVSRCTLLNFRKATLQEIEHCLIRVLKSENVSFEQEAVDLLAKRADGSFRDAVKLLELATINNQLSKKNVEKVFGISYELKVINLIEAVLAKDESKLASLIEELRLANTDQKFFYRTLFDFLHSSLMQSLGVKKGQAFLKQEVALFLLNYLLKIDLQTSSPIPFLSLEIALLELIFKSKKQAGDEGKKKSKSSPEVKSKKQLRAQNTTLKKESFSKKDNKTEKVVSSSVSQISHLLFDRWEEFLEMVANENSALAALLRSGKPDANSNGKALINVYYKFHQEQLQEPRFLSVIEACSEKLFGERVQFEFNLIKTASETKIADFEKNDLAELAEEVLM